MPASGLTLSQYQSLIRRLQVAAARAPSAYKLRVAALAVAGIAYITLMLGLAIGLLAASVWLLVVSKAYGAAKLLVIPAGFAWLVFRAISLRLEPPEGRPVTRAEAPELHAEIESIRASLNARRIDVVLLTDQLNAAVTQIPRLGLLGWNRTYLVLGVPLLATLSRAEARAVIAHELGHLARNHARFGNWIYRIRRTWSQLHAMLEERGGWGAKLFAPFFHWYAPYFAAYSFVLARTNELEADAQSAEVAGKDAAGQALMRVHVHGAMLTDDYWKHVYERVGREAEPPQDVHSSGLEACARITPQDAHNILAGALAAPPGFQDTHPTLAERLRALGVAPELGLRTGPTAAQALLGPLAAELIAQYDARWHDSVAPQWRERFEGLRAARARLAELDFAADGRALAQADAWERIELVRQLDGPEAALPALAEFATVNRDHAQAQFAYGAMLIGRDDAAGVEYLDRASLADEELRMQAASVLLEFYRRRDDAARMDHYEALLEEARVMLLAARAERTHIRGSDTFADAGLAPDMHASWASIVRRQRTVKRAWVARKVVRHLPGRPCYVISVQFRMFARGRQAAMQSIVDDIPIGENAVLVVRPHDSLGAGRKIKAVPGAALI